MIIANILSVFGLMFVGSSYGGSIMGGPYEYSPIQNKKYIPAYPSQSFKVSGKSFLYHSQTGRLRRPFARPSGMGGIKVVG